jgi:hypothetical protein
LLAIDLAAAKLVPEAKESGLCRQRVPAESLYRAVLVEIHNAL